jgi:hypothetical protein
MPGTGRWQGGARIVYCLDIQVGFDLAIVILIV